MFSTKERLENIGDDAEYIFKKLNFTTRLPNSHKSSQKPKKRPKVASYYSNLPRSAVKQIYRKYYLDFVTFGFSAELGLGSIWYFFMVTHTL